MSRGRDRFWSEAEGREQTRHRAAQPMYSFQNNTPARQDGQTRASYPGTNPAISQSVNDHLKELRTMSSSNPDGRTVHNVSSFGSGPPQHRNPHGMEDSGRIQNPGIGQHHRSQMPPGPPSSSVPFLPPVPPPPFNPSMPPPGLPPPFRGPHPPVGSGGSDAMFSRPPPPLPAQGATPGYPLGNMARVPGPVNVGVPPPSVQTGLAAAPVSARPPASQTNFRMGSPSDGISVARPGFGTGSAVPQDPFLPPPPPRPDSNRLLSSNLTAVDKSVSGAGKPMSGGPSGEMDDDAGISAAQEEVNRWLQEKGKWKQEAAVAGNGCKTGKTGASEDKDSRERKATLSIGEAQDRLRSVLHALAAVQGELQQLEEERGTADVATWKAKVSKIRQLKEENRRSPVIEIQGKELERVKSHFSFRRRLGHHVLEVYLETKQNLDTKQIKNLKRKLDLRRKKRERQKRCREEEKEVEQQVQFERAQKHAAIDQWREKLRQDDLNQQQMKKMKETADKTLSKVRKDIRETRKMMDTVSRLQKLRAIRNDTAEKRGQTFSPSIANHFTEKTDDLIQLLSQQLDAFEKEEAALKLILETENEEAKEKEKEEKRRKEREVRQKEMEEERHSLFGSLDLPCPGDPMQPYAQYYLQAQCSLEALQNIRQQWDTFLVPETTPLATRVPDGWVRPEPPSSSVWASVLQTSSS